MARVRKRAGRSATVSRASGGERLSAPLRRGPFFPFSRPTRRCDHMRGPDPLSRTTGGGLAQRAVGGRHDQLINAADWARFGAPRAKRKPQLFSTRASTRSSEFVLLRQPLDGEGAERRVFSADPLTMRLCTEFS